MDTKESLSRPFRVIAISQYLADYFRDKKLKVCRIPVIMDINESESCSEDINRDNLDTVRLIYAGSPASKDHLKEMIDAINLLNSSETQRFSLSVFGVNEEQMRTMCAIDKLPKNVTVYGRVQRERIVRELQSADFSVLLRLADERYAKAGFPTKAVEAMSNGVAMMCNLSSDLGLYLRNGENALVVKDCTSEAVADTLRQVIKLQRSEIEMIKFNAKKTAKEYFDYRLYIDTLKDLIS